MIEAHGVGHVVSWDSRRTTLDASLAHEAESTACASRTLVLSSAVVEALNVEELVGGRLVSPLTPCRTRRAENPRDCEQRVRHNATHRPVIVTHTLRKHCGKDGARLRSSCNAST